jgi:hypothetical protein
MNKLEKLKERLKEINKLLKGVNIKKGCLAVNQRIELEKEKKRVKNKLKK